MPSKTTPSRSLERMVGRRSVFRGFYAQRQNKHAVVANGLPDDGLIVVVTPCFKFGGFDFYTNRDITGLLNASLTNFGLTEPLLVSRGPVRVGKERRYFFKLVSGIEWNRKLCHKVKPLNESKLSDSPGEGASRAKETHE